LPSFVISMLRIGQIVTANTLEKREITAARISLWTKLNAIRKSNEN
jgi:hypothetical protein